MILDNLKILQHLNLEKNQLTTISELLKLKLETPLFLQIDREKIPQAELEKMENLAYCSGGRVSGSSRIDN